MAGMVQSLIDVQPSSERWRELCPEVIHDSIDPVAALVTGQACCLAEDVKPKVQGYATQRVRERLDRGLVAVPEAGQVYLGWRLLNDDPADIAFNIYRRSGPVAVKLNAEPIRRTTDFVDTLGPGRHCDLISFVP